MNFIRTLFLHLIARWRMKKRRKQLGLAKRKLTVDEINSACDFKSLAFDIKLHQTFIRKEALKHSDYYEKDRSNQKMPSKEEAEKYFDKFKRLT